MSRQGMWGALLALELVTVILANLASPGAGVSWRSACGNSAPALGDGEQNPVLNPGFESGGFAPWVNLGGTGYNSISSEKPYSGSYSVFLDSHLSSAPYEPVYQDLTDSPSLETDPRVTAAIFPTKTGNTCGQAGVSELGVTIYDEVSDASVSIIYEWSGYTYPNHDLGANLSCALYLLFNWTPNVWNILNRSLLTDYSSIFGTPANASTLKVTRISLLAHVSNGDPGDFYADDISIGASAASVADTSEPIGNPGFETGEFPPWINDGGTSYNRIVSSIARSGTYSLFMESHTSSVPYEPVYQDLSVNVSLAEDPRISAYIRPEKVGNTAGACGASWASVDLANRVENKTTRIAWLWSGYTYPLNEWGANDTWPIYTLFEWIPNSWNKLERSLLNDYTGLLGAPSNPSDWIVTRVSFLAHVSNGDPGSFYVDDVSLSGPLPSDTTNPMIDHPEDIEYVFGTLGHEITWNATDENPDAYSLFVNGSLHESGLWNGEQLTVDVDGLEEGAYIYRMVVYDSSNNSASDEVVVSVSSASASTILMLLPQIITAASLAVVVVVSGAFCKNRPVQPIHSDNYAST